MISQRKKSIVPKNYNIPLIKIQQNPLLNEQKKLLLEQIKQLEKAYQQRNTYYQTLLEQNKQIEQNFAKQTKRLAQVRNQIRKFKVIKLQNKKPVQNPKPNIKPTIKKRSKSIVPKKQLQRQRSFSEYNPNNIDIDNMSYQEINMLIEQMGYVSVGLKQNEIQNLKKDTFNNLGQMDQKCSICMDEYCGNDILIVLPCEHGFHEECIKTWMNDKKLCPLCKESIL